MKILSAEQTKAAEQHTVQQEPIASIDLMERAAGELFDWFQMEFDPSVRVSIFCGPGNNGGDGLALARMLHEAQWQVEVWLCEERGSEDFETNLNRLPEDILRNAAFEFKADELNTDILVDAIFGSGLNRPLEGAYQTLILELNKALGLKVSIDIPSGLFADDNRDNDIPRVFNAQYTLSFQHPKLALMQVPGSELAGQTVVLDIGLDPEFYQEAKSDHYYLEFEDVQVFYRERAKHSCKGSYGHSFHLCGSEDKLGAALIAAEASLRVGTGLVTASLPDSGFAAANARIPELMLESRSAYTALNLSKYQSVLIGPGFGQSKEQEHILKQAIQDYGGAMVFDADALRMLANNPTWLNFLPEGSILTPHFGELKALLGRKDLGLDYMEACKEFAFKYRVYLLVKNSISAIVSPNGKVYYADFGSAALAKGGSGDLLAGLIAGLRAMSYAPFPALVLALYLQGKSAKMAAEASHAHSVLSSDILRFIGLAYSSLEP